MSGLMTNDLRTLLWLTPLALGLGHLVNQGYLMCSKGPDPDWASRATVLKADKPQPGAPALNRWGGSAEAALLRQSVSRWAGAPASLSNVFVVRDKPMNYLTTRRNEINPLPRPHVDGYPLVFCGHAKVKGKLQRFSYMPEIQELILLDITARTEIDLARDDWRAAQRNRKVEAEFRRLCGRSLEGGGLLMSSL